MALYKLTPKPRTLISSLSFTISLLFSVPASLSLSYSHLTCDQLIDSGTSRGNSRTHSLTLRYAIDLRHLGTRSHCVFKARDEEPCRYVHAFRCVPATNLRNRSLHWATARHDGRPFICGESRACVFPFDARQKRERASEREREKIE